MLLLILLYHLFQLLPVLAAGSDRSSPPPIAPPAGRALLSRGASLEPFDYPPSSSLYPILGPPSFWRESSLHTHYLSTLHLRYHPILYPTPPPFAVWLKEQQLLRSIALLTQTIELETSRKAHFSVLLQHEMQLGELSVLLRYTQIATALRYASLAPEWRRWEESMYRHWGAFLAVGQSAAAERGGEEGRWREHLAYLERLGVAKVEEERRAEERERTDGRSGWRGAPVGRGDLESSTPKRWTHTPQVGASPEVEGNDLRARLQSSTPRRWQEAPESASSAAHDLVEGVQEAVQRGPRHV
ncbi:Integrase-like, catalytic core [Kalmanozyma brasiliensis GHG001]|uniref:Integrase-like, catalytic core n=1 Tax=Kalmanozyma brasiliensis (strain GHG001) TaxID=1365824 RepID=UPI002867E340|nr:Integrase-like, catalytic core [Kalmanozyma brasiliensis GHG001]KAF6767674.1 Integrase-like, catalytic core [Kalmanozyma brasiliensis GHG001]